MLIQTGVMGISEIFSATPSAMSEAVVTVFPRDNTAHAPAPILSIRFLNIHVLARFVTTEKSIMYSTPEISTMVP